MSASTTEQGEYPLPGEPGYGIKERIARAWCRLMHRDAMLPIHGQYRCRRCYRSYPIHWSDEPEGNGSKRPR